MQHFAGAFQHDAEVIKNAMLETWSKGRTKGRNNRLKTLKWTKCGRAGIGLRCARLMVFDA
jgi:transposase